MAQCSPKNDATVYARDVHQDMKRVAPAPGLAATTFHGESDHMPDQPVPPFSGTVDFKQPGDTTLSAPSATPSLWTLADSLPLGVIVGGPDGTAGFANETWTAMTGQQALSWIGHGWFRVLPADERQTEVEAVVAALAGGESTVRTWSITDPVGQTQVLTVTVTPETQSSAGGFVATISEQTRISRAVEEEAARFLAIAAHELRAPVSTIVDLIAILRGQFKALSDSDREAAWDGLERQSNRLGQLVDNVLSMAAHGATPLEAPTIVSVVETVAEALETAPPPSSVALEVLTVEPNTPSTPALVRVGHMALLRVLVNLLTNAYRYGGSNIAVTIHSDNKHVAIAIADDGPGLPVEHRTVLFEPFARGTNAESHLGLGVGLPLARSIIESFRGTLTYQPGDPSGSVLTIKLPTAVAPA
jgi:PAS domain S-box-containing protein